MSPSDKKIIRSLRTTLQIVEHSPHFFPAAPMVLQFKRDVEDLIAELEAKG